MFLCRHSVTATCWSEFARHPRTQAIGICCAGRHFHFVWSPGFAYQFKIMGSDVAGQVEAVGRNVTQFRPGDEVFGELSRCGFGAYAEFAAAPEKALALKPANGDRSIWDYRRADVREGRFCAILFQTVRNSLIPKRRDVGVVDRARSESVLRCRRTEFQMQLVACRRKSLQ
jgi:hypothetical protein